MSFSDRLERAISRLPPDRRPHPVVVEDLDGFGDGQAELVWNQTLRGGVVSDRGQVFCNLSIEGTRSDRVPADGVLSFLELPHSRDLAELLALLTGHAEAIARALRDKRAEIERAEHDLRAARDARWDSADG